MRVLLSKFVKIYFYLILFSFSPFCLSASISFDDFPQDGIRNFCKNVNSGTQSGIRCAELLKFLRSARFQPAKYRVKEANSKFQEDRSSEDNQVLYLASEIGDCNFYKKDKVCRQLIQEITSEATLSEEGKQKLFTSVLNFLQTQARLNRDYDVLVQDATESKNPLKFIKKWGQLSEGVGNQSGYKKEEAEVQEENIRLSDIEIIGNIPEEIQDLKRILEEDESYKRFGIKKPKGILLYGPPGAGKTLLARYIAASLEIPFIYASASSFMALYVGTGPKAINDTFNRAKNLIKAGAKAVIIFLDEIDCLGSRKKDDNGEQIRTLTTLLTQMDGFERSDSIIVLAATNRPGAIDSALKRPGRFDYEIYLGLPDAEKRRAILEKKFKEKPLSDEIEFDYLVDITKDFSCAELVAFVDKSALFAARSNAECINLEHINKALDDLKSKRESKGDLS